jgi:hypothetical protein
MLTDDDQLRTITNLTMKIARPLVWRNVREHWPKILYVPRSKAPKARWGE